MSILSLIANDPNVSPELAAAFGIALANPNAVAAIKAAPRRFTGEPLTGFGDLTDDADYSNFGERAARMAEYDRELRDDCRGLGDDSCADWGDEVPR